jgi:hypothetical protein
MFSSLGIIVADATGDSQDTIAEKDYHDRMTNTMARRNNSATYVFNGGAIATARACLGGALIATRVAFRRSPLGTRIATARACGPVDLISRRALAPVPRHVITAKTGASALRLIRGIAVNRLNQQAPWLGGALIRGVSVLAWLGWRSCKLVPASPPNSP